MDVLHISHTETCEDCLELSANITTATVGDVIMIISSITQRPHSGISLLVNGSIARNEDFPCHTTSHVLGPEVIFHCTARKSGTMIIKSNVGIDFTSQQILISIEEKTRSMYK